MSNKIIFFITFVTLIASQIDAKLSRCYNLPQCSKDLEASCTGQWDEVNCKCIKPQCLQTEACIGNFMFNSDNCACECNRMQVAPHCPNDRWIKDECKCLHVTPRKRKNQGLKIDDFK